MVATMVDTLEKSDYLLSYSEFSSPLVSTVSLLKQNSIPFYYLGKSIFEIFGKRLEWFLFCRPGLRRDWEGKKKKDRFVIPILFYFVYL